MFCSLFSIAYFVLRFGSKNVNVAPPSGKESAERFPLCFDRSSPLSQHLLLQMISVPAYISAKVEINAFSSRMSCRTMGTPADIAVLFVDDEVEILTALKNCFRRESYVKMFAESGEQALTLLEESTGNVPVSVIISDIHMPGINGMELIQRVKSRFPDIICMLVSGTCDINEIVKDFDVGHVFTTLTKPINVPVFKKIINNAIDCYLSAKLTSSSP